MELGLQRTVLIFLLTFCFARTSVLFCWNQTHILLLPFLILLNQNSICYHRILIFLPPAREFATCIMAESRLTTAAMKKLLQPSFVFAMTGVFFRYIHETALR